VASDKRNAAAPDESVQGSRAKVSLLSELARRCAPGLAASFAASFFTTLCLLALPLYMFQTFDRVLGSGNENTLMP
jgi:ABC-type protease/lipase transport system, ATPase and permease components